MAEATTRYPAYVTDGHHIYPWNEHYTDFLASGKLKACEAPEPPKVKKLSQREKTKLEQMRVKALQEAQEAVRLFSNGETSSEVLFGSPPKE